MGNAVMFCIIFCSKMHIFCFMIVCLVQTKFPLSHINLIYQRRLRRDRNWPLMKVYQNTDACAEILLHPYYFRKKSNSADIYFTPQCIDISHTLVDQNRKISPVQPSFLLVLQDMCLLSVLVFSTHSFYYFFLIAYSTMVICCCEHVLKAIFEQYYVFNILILV